MKPKDIIKTKIKFGNSPTFAFDNSKEQAKEKKYYNSIKDKDCIVAVWEYDITKNKLIITSWRSVVCFYHLCPDSYNSKINVLNRLSDNIFKQIMNKGVIYQGSSSEKRIKISPIIYNEEKFDLIKLNYIYNKI